MTNTKFRKKALLSSVAMLIVAMIALGSATFAWFVANPKVEADGLSMQAVSAPGLYIASDSVLAAAKTTGEEAYAAEHESTEEGYAAALAAAGEASMLAAYNTTTDFYTTAVSLKPASPLLSGVASWDSKDDLTFGEIDAALSSAYGLDESDNFASAGTFTHNDAAAFVYYEDLWLKQSSSGSGTTSIDAIRVDISRNTAVNISKGLKVAVVDNAGNLLGIWKADSSSDTQYASALSGHALAYYTNDATSSGTTKYLTTGDAVTISTPISVAGAIKGADGAVSVRVYVYLDGEDENVTSSAVLTMTELASDIKVSLSTAGTTKLNS